MLKIIGYVNNDQSMLIEVVRDAVQGLYINPDGTLSHEDTIKLMERIFNGSFDYHRALNIAKGGEF